MNSWTPAIGQEIHFKREVDNKYDKYAVAGVFEDAIVGRVPKELTKCFSKIVEHKDLEIKAHVYDEKKKRSQSRKGLEILLDVKVEGSKKQLNELKSTLTKMKKTIPNLKL